MIWDLCAYADQRGADARGVAARPATDRTRRAARGGGVGLPYEKVHRGRRAVTYSRRLQSLAREPRTIVAPPLPRRRCISRQAAFLAAFRKTASVRAAAEAAEIAPTRHFQWLEKDPRYWEAFAEAQREVADALQGEAIERAVQGWLEPVFHRGGQCGTIRHRSDRLLIVLLKAWMPEKYR